MWYIGDARRMRLKTAHFVGDACGLDPTSQRSTRAGAFVFVAAAAQLSAQTPQGIAGCACPARRSPVVSFELRDGLTPEVLAAIDSGLKTTFTYIVDLAVGRPGWMIGR